MHEAGIAAEILNIAKAQAAAHGNMRVSEVAVRLGEMSGVVAEALEFAFEALRDGAAARATLDIRRIPVLARCEECSVETRPGADLVLWCEQCGRPMKVLEGEELTVESVVLEDSEE